MRNCIGLECVEIIAYILRPEAFHFLESEVPDSSGIFYFTFIGVLKHTNFIATGDKGSIISVSNGKLRVAFAGFPCAYYSLISFVLRFRIF